MTKRQVYYDDASGDLGLMQDGVFEALVPNIAELPYEIQRDYYRMCGELENKIGYLTFKVQQIANACALMKERLDAEWDIHIDDLI